MALPGRTSEVRGIADVLAVAIGSAMCSVRGSELGNGMNKHIDRADIDVVATPPLRAEVPQRAALSGSGHPLFRAGKRLFDVVVAILSLPVIAVIGVVLLLLNPLWNAGPLFFLQTRMGRDCKPFRAVKFRSMRPATAIMRGPDDPLESDRITPLGHWLRRSRIDELPQLLNVLVGQMSVVGPRPDFWDHAIHYLDTIPGYRQRHQVRPGITGLAQVDGGYAEGLNATLEKTRQDLRYIREGGLGMELYVLWRTIHVLMTGFGAR